MAKSGNSGGGKGSNKGGFKGSGRGGGKGGRNLPSKTNQPSGKYRDNSPPKRK